MCAAVGMSPFNLFSGMGGKRSKVTETDLWKEGEEEEEGPEVEPWDGENPLESGVKYDHAMTKDGFIHARKQPKKIVRPERCVIGEGGVCNLRVEYCMIGEGGVGD